MREGRMSIREAYRFFRLYGNPRIVALCKTYLWLHGEKVYVYHRRGKDEAREGS